MIILDEIQTHRKELGWSQDDLARICGVGVSTVRRAEKDLNLCSVSSVRKITEALFKYEKNTYVYIAEAVNEKIVKIGLTSNLTKRINEISNTDTECVSVGYVKDMRERARLVEKMSHGFLLTFHVRGEWFDIDNKYAVAIVKMCSTAVNAVFNDITDPLGSNSEQLTLFYIEKHYEVTQLSEWGRVVDVLDALFPEGHKDIKAANSGNGECKGRKLDITPDRAKLIKKYVQEGRTQAEAAKYFNVSTRAVSYIMNDKYFANQKKKGKKK